jgi:hypothetical protein
VPAVVLDATTAPVPVPAGAEGMVESPGAGGGVATMTWVVLTW